MKGMGVAADCRCCCKECCIGDGIATPPTPNVAVATDVGDDEDPIGSLGIA